MKSQHHSRVYSAIALCYTDSGRYCHPQAATALRRLALRAIKTATAHDIMEQNLAAVCANEVALLGMHVHQLAAEADTRAGNKAPASHDPLARWLQLRHSLPRAITEALSGAAGAAPASSRQSDATDDGCCPGCGAMVEWTGQDPLAIGSQARCRSEGCGITFSLCAATLALCRSARPWRCACCERRYDPNFFQQAEKAPACLYCGLLLCGGLPTWMFQMDGL